MPWQCISQGESSRIFQWKMEQKRLFLFAGEEEKLRGLVETIKGKNHRMLYVKYVYILHKIIYKFTDCPKEYQAHGVPLNVHDLQDYMGGPCKDVEDIIEKLQLWGYIKPKNPHQATQSAATYQLAKPYENRKLTMGWFTRKDGKFIQKLLDEWKERLKEPLIQSVLEIFNTKVSLSEEGLTLLQDRYNTPGMAQMIGWHQDGTIQNRHQELNKLVGDLKIRREDMVLFSFLLKDFYATPPQRTRRMFTNLTNLKREYRRFVLLEGKPLLETDIVNSQPTFSIPLINQTLEEMHGKGYKAQDMELYALLATSGKFYEELAMEAGVDISTGEQRREFKENFYKQVFFSRVYPSKDQLKLAFTRLFPSAFAAICRIKKDNYRRFAILLQDLEAELMIYEVMAKMLEEGHTVLSIHDSLVVNNQESLRYAEQLIQERFQTKYGLTISFKSTGAAKDASVNEDQPVKSLVTTNETVCGAVVVKPAVKRFEFPGDVTRDVAFQFFQTKKHQYFSSSNRVVTDAELKNYLANSFLSRKDLSETQRDYLKVFLKEFMVTSVIGQAA